MNKSHSGLSHFIRSCKNYVIELSVHKSTEALFDMCVIESKRQKLESKKKKFETKKRRRICERKFSNNFVCLSVLLSVSVSFPHGQIGSVCKQVTCMSVCAFALLGKSVGWCCYTLPCHWQVLPQQAYPLNRQSFLSNKS